MAASYSEALDLLNSVAQDISSRKANESEFVAIKDAAGRQAAQDYCSLVSTPEFDTAAMDGFAICSGATARATPQNPVIFAVIGTTAAGDRPMSIETCLVDDMLPCVEIMTGARFPRVKPGVAPLDACVKLEDTHQVHLSKGDSLSSHRCIGISNPVTPRANRRFAGSDIPKGTKIVAEGQVIHSGNIMQLASLGITNLSVPRAIRTGIWSTGNEVSPSLPPGASTISDINGPYLTAALREYGSVVSFLGTVGDSEEETDRLVCNLTELVESGKYDVLITTGGVSVGRFDFVKRALHRAEARVHFHGLPIRPGHPVLFASLTSCMGRQTAFFGLPGNPGATAATFKFLVLPFLSRLKGHRQEIPIWASLGLDIALNDRDGRWKKGSSKDKQFPKNLDCFRHGIVGREENGRWTVKLSLDQSPSKVLPFARANCWVHIPQGFQAMEKALVPCFELFPGSIPR